MFVQLLRVVLLLAALGALYLTAQRVGAVVVDAGRSALARFA